MLTFIQVRAVVVCLNATLRVRGVDMEGIKMGAYSFDGAETLTRRELLVGKISLE